MVYNSLINSGQFTEFGRKHNFQHINEIKDYKKNVPVHEYDDLKPYIQKMMEGSQNVLWNSPISWFAKSSGTTSDKSKFIPVSNESLEECHYKSAKDVLALYYRNFPQLGHSHWQVFDTRWKSSNQSTQCRIILRRLIRCNDSKHVLFYSLIRTPDTSIALMQEWEEKIQKMAQSTILEDVTMIAGVPTWTIVLIQKNI